MALVSFVSAHGAPGVTTVALATAHHLGRLRGDASIVLEANPDGGTIAARRSMTPSPGLAEVAGAARVSLVPTDIERFSQRLSPHADVVLAHPGLEQTAAALRTLGPQFATVDWSAIGFDVVVDAGRVRPGGLNLPILDVSDMVLVVVRSTAESVVSTMHRLELIEASAAAVGLVLVGSDPYGAAEVANACGIPVFAHVPWDPKALARDPLGDRPKSELYAAFAGLARNVIAECSAAAVTTGDVGDDRHGGVDGLDEADVHDDHEHRETGMSALSGPGAGVADFDVPGEPDGNVDRHAAQIDEPHLAHAGAVR